MSTDYYGFRKPITSIRAEVMGGHIHVGIWVNHAKSGTLIFRNEEWEEAKFYNRSWLVLEPNTEYKKDILEDIKNCEKHLNKNKDDK